MFASALRAIARTLTASLELPVRSTVDLSPEEIQRCGEALAGAHEDVVDLTISGRRFVGARPETRADHECILAGPLRLEGDAGGEGRRLSSAELARIHTSLAAAIASLREVEDEPRRLLDASRQMEILSSAIIAISSELQLDAVLRSITDLARTFASARYAALGVPNAEGRLETFITAGVTAADEARIGHRPEGRGLLGKLLTERYPVRIDDLTQHPDAMGFPEHHPPMKSFLGVPIISAGGEIIGSLYLAEKRGAHGFTVEDEMLIELLARHAAVAIDNARLYRRLEQDERRLGQILDQLPAAVMLIEPNPERIVVMNRQARELLGLTSPLPVEVAELADAYTFTNAGEEPVDVAATPFLRGLRSGVAIEREELTVTGPSGAHHTLLVNSAPLALDGVVEAYICVFQDITAIRDADRLKDDFLSLVSHELRTPLTTIHGGAQLLLKEADHLDRQIRDELLADINQESARLAALIQNMVQLTHVRAGRVAFEPEPVLLRMLVARCVGQMAPLDPSRDYDVDVGPEVVALADANRVDEMLRNVIHNALKYTPPGSPIEIAGRVAGETVQLSVRDHGPGIPEREIGQAFDRFERGSQATSATSGMGLGLYLVRLLVEAQGGTVAIELPPDGGTRVVFTLPRAEGEE